ncbi:UNKNOWN [Stylonychia lemnae]|uniref:Uncharacterized protein n=1 Tax=Stylonychia lemnae TaxID=5949 RepID=A0A078A8R3_STYLE|nr:UNKNOWN [Stylonychia lemnae]|eukprot:CDW78271.1 UNKNOWN [Stylonychia lemnae]
MPQKQTTSEINTHRSNRGKTSSRLSNKSNPLIQNSKAKKQQSNEDAQQQIGIQIIKALSQLIKQLSEDDIFLLSQRLYMQFIKTEKTKREAKLKKALKIHAKYVNQQIKLAFNKWHMQQSNLSNKVNIQNSFRSVQRKNEQQTQQQQIRIPIIDISKSNQSISINRNSAEKSVRINLGPETSSQYASVIIHETNSKIHQNKTIDYNKDSISIQNQSKARPFINETYLELDDTNIIQKLNTERVSNQGLDIRKEYQKYNKVLSPRKKSRQTLLENQKKLNQDYKTHLEEVRHKKSILSGNSLESLSVNINQGSTHSSYDNDNNINYVTNQKQQQSQQNHTQHQFMTPQNHQTMLSPYSNNANQNIRLSSQSPIRTNQSAYEKFFQNEQLLEKQRQDLLKNMNIKINSKIQSAVQNNRNGNTQFIQDNQENIDRNMIRECTFKDLKQAHYSSERISLNSNNPYESNPNSNSNTIRIESPSSRSRDTNYKKYDFLLLTSPSEKTNSLYNSSMNSSPRLIDTQSQFKTLNNNVRVRDPKSANRNTFQHKVNIFEYGTTRI